MFCAFQIAAVLAMSTGLDESGGMKMNPAVAAAIGSFTPFWTPPKHSLSGVTIVIHPIGGGATSAPQRTCDDNSLLTASFLRHFIKQAGGRAIVTRLGDGPSVFDQADSISPLEFARDADRAAYISIGFDRDSKQTVVRFETANASTKTDDRLRQFLTSTMDPDGINVEKVSDLRNRLVKEAGAASDLAAVAQSVCQVVFVCPERGNRREQRDRMHCRKLARSLCEGLIQSFEGSITQSGADQSDVDVVGLDRARGTARRLRPQGDLPPDKLNWFVELYTALSGSSGSFTYFDISIEKVGEGYSVVGSTNAPGVVNGLLAALHEVGVRDVKSNFRTLPDRERLGGMIHGVCTASAFRTYSCPDPADGLIRCGEQTQLLYGEPVYLLDRDGNSLLVQAADGYWGWVSTAAIRPVDEASFHAYTSLPRGAVVADIESGAIRIPRGASLPVVGNDAGRIQVQLPTGELFPIAASAIRVDRTADSRARDRVRAALDLLQTPYLFGGRSPLGLDCSGLVTNVWRRVDLPCSRDAWQQALAGDMVATSWDREGLRAGDQVFFMGASGKIYHTGIAISTHHVLHAAAPGVQISSIKKGDRLYHARLDRDFFIAKRP